MGIVRFAFRLTPRRDLLAVAAWVKAKRRGDLAVRPRHVRYCASEALASLAGFVLLSTNSQLTVRREMQRLKTVLLSYDPDDLYSSLSRAAFASTTCVVSSSKCVGCWQ